MPRAKNSVASRERRRKVLERAEGFRGGRSKLFRTAQESVNKALAYSYRDRKAKKRTFRQLWILRIGAACKERGVSYSTFVNSLIKSNVKLNRKMMAEMAVNDKEGFDQLVELAKK